MSRARETGVGILFFGALIGLGVLTVTLTEFTLFGLFGRTYEMIVYFDDAAGLKTGDNVQVMGVIRGSVEEVEFLSEPVRFNDQPDEYRVRTVLTCDVPLESFLRKDFAIRIRNANLLGGKVVDVELGSSSEPIAPGIAARGFHGIASADPLEQISDVIADNRVRFDRIVANVDRFAGDISSMTEDIREGEGVIHDLIYDRSMGETVRGTLVNMRNAMEGFEIFVREVRSGKGMLSNFIYNEDWPADVTAILNRTSGLVDSAAIIAADIRAGKGVAGQAIYNETWTAQVSSLLEGAEGIVTHVSAGDGPIGLLLFDETLRTGISETVANIHHVSQVIDGMAQNLAEGKGLIGLLLTDEAVAAKVRALLDQALMSLEDAREAAPISSLGSFLFGAF